MVHEKQTRFSVVAEFFSFYLDWPFKTDDQVGFQVWMYLDSEPGLVCSTRKGPGIEFRFKSKVQVQTKSGLGLETLMDLWTLSPAVHAKDRFSLIFKSIRYLNAVLYYRTLEQKKWQEHNRKDEKFLRLLSLGLWEVVTVKCLCLLHIFSLSAGGDFTTEKLNSLETSSKKM